MPGYGTLTIPPAVYPGDQVTVINNEQPVSGTQSQQVALAQNASGNPQKLSVQVVFAAAPGAFEIDLQTSDTDNPADYVSNATTISQVDANNVARAEFPNIVALFALLYTKTQNANAVNCTATITR